MPLYKVGREGLRVLRRDRTVIDYPPGQVVAFRRLPDRFEGFLTEIKADPKKGVYEDKSRRAKEDKVVAGVEAPPPITGETDVRKKLLDQPAVDVGPAADVIGKGS